MAVVVYSVNPYRALFDDGGGARFSFNGVDQYATMPGWAANGKPRQYWFNFNADAVATGTEQVIVSGVDGGIALEFYLHATLPALSIRYRSATGTQAIEGVTGIDIVPGNDYVIHVINLGTGSEVYVNNILIDIIAFEASAGIQPALTHMGAGHELARFFGGQLWSDRLVDDSPINDTYANMGDGSRYGELEQDIVIPAGNDFEMSFDWIRLDRTTTANRLVCGTGTAIRVDDSGSVAPNRINIVTSATNAVSNNALDGVAQGQHITLDIGWTSAGGWSASVDGVDKVITGNAPPDMVFNTLMADVGGLAPIPANSAMQNIVIKDLTQGLTWDYGLDEGSGTDIINSDPSTPGYNGSCTPDTAWAFIPDNTRFYPMNEGMGDTFKAYNGKGEETPVNDATIVNFTDNWS